MYDRKTRTRVLGLVASGRSFKSISREFAIARATVRDWARDPDAALRERTGDRCWACAGTPCPLPATYAYLLGQYLGDGYLVTSARVPRLRIACADRYPAIAVQVDEAMHALSGNRVNIVQSIGCSDHSTSWMHWPCLLPQHGPGRKHERPIVLGEWQREIVAREPWSLVRGLIHSDGCRAINRVVVRGKAYAYPRYFLSNESRDILAIMGEALDTVGVQWRYNRHNSISVARRESVELMERNVGPKR